MPEDGARRLLLEVEQVLFLAELAVVALFRLFQPREIRLQLLVVRPRGAVDALEHLVARVASPVRSGDLHQLEGAQLAGARHVRTAAQVHPVRLTVQADFLGGGNAGDDFGLVDLALIPEELDRIVAAHDTPRDLVIGFRQVAHALFDRDQVLGRERPLVGEIVVEAVFDHRADRHLRIGKQLLHRLRQQVRGGVADDLQPFGVPVRDDGEPHVTVDDVRRVDQLAVDLAGERGLGQPGTDVRRYLLDRDGFGISALTAVRQGNDWHRDAKWWALQGLNL